MLYIKAKNFFGTFSDLKFYHLMRVADVFLSFLFFFLHVHVIYFQCGFFKRVKPKDYEPTFQGEIKKSKDYDNVDYT